MGKVIYPRKGEVHTTPVTTLPNFADNSWAAIIAACETNTVPETWEVGDQKAMTINGTDYLIDIIGKNHDTYTAGGTAPLTFQMHDCYGTTYTINDTHVNTTGWTDSAMRTTHLPTILSLMPPEVQAGIKEVSKMATTGSKVLTTVADRMFLLSEIEIFGSTAQSQKSEGSQYAYYAAGNSRVKTINGSASAWWERSLYYANTVGMCMVDTSGVSSNMGAANSLGVSFAFCF